MMLFTTIYTLIWLEKIDFESLFVFDMNSLHFLSKIYGNFKSSLKKYKKKMTCRRQVILSLKTKIKN